MKNVKKYMVTAVLLLIYISAVTLLLRSFYVYQEAYHQLGRLISHSSVELLYDEEE